MSTMRQDDQRTCGSQHLRLATAIIGVVLAICTATIAYCHTTVAAMDARMRKVEQNDAANAARIEAIKDALERMEGAG